MASEREYASWSSQEMLENANNWSLGGDAAILNRLRQFSHTVISNTEHLNVKVVNLLNNLENVSLRLELTKNEFQSLRNTQFIENRVYEDDETLDNEEKEVPKKQEPTDEDMKHPIKRFISQGLMVMEKYYEKVELAVSDSEEETNNKSYVLQPKDIYAERPLPYLVGTDDWCKHWHVGLLSSDSDSDIEREDQEEAESNSENCLPKNRTPESETSSELDNHSNSCPIANSTFNDSQDRKRETIYSPDRTSEQSNSVPVQTPLSNENFADQLAAKLGNIISGPSDKADFRTKPSMKQEHNFGRVFADEPPPLDDTLLSKSSQVPQFRNRHRDLFVEDSDDDLFCIASQESNNSSDRNNAVSTTQSFADTLNSSLYKKPHVLFDSSESLSDEDNPYMSKPNKTIAFPFIDEQPPKIAPKYNRETTKKRPTVLGPNIDIFGQKGAKKQELVKKDSLFDGSTDEEAFLPKVTIGEPKKVQREFFYDEFISQIKKTVEPVKEYDTFSNNPVKKHISLFDDDHDNFLKEEEDIFSFKSSKGGLISDFSTESFKRGLTDDLEDDSSAKEIGLSESLESSNKKASSIESNREEKTITKLDSYKKSSRLTESDNNLAKEDGQRSLKPSANSSLFSKDDKDTDDMIFNTSSREETTGKVDIKTDQSKSENFKSNDNLPESLKDMPRAEKNYVKNIRSLGKTLLNISTEQKVDCEPKSNQINDENEFLKENVGIVDSNSQTCESDLKDDLISEASLTSEIVKQQVDQQTTQEEAVDFEAAESRQYKPSINLYDPTPPPIDWDATSDNSVESDRFSISDGFLDRLNYDQSQLTVSSVFDEAPPSLNAHDINYSSRVAQVINFNSDQRIEHQDSFFLTKTQTENQSQLPNLNQITKIPQEIFSRLENVTSCGGVANINDRDSLFDNSSSNDSDGTGPGKLKHNLSINIEALLPGAALSRNRPSEIKSLCSDETDKNDESQFDIDKSVTSVDGQKFTLHETEVLQHVTKDRAKIPIKRRPSTRKARLAAIQKSTQYSFYDVDVTAKTVTHELETGNNVKTTDNIPADILVSNKIETPEPNGISLVFDSNKEKEGMGVIISRSNKYSVKNTSFFDCLGDVEDIFKPSKKGSELHDLDDGSPRSDLFVKKQAHSDISSDKKGNVKDYLFSRQKESLSDHKDISSVPQTSSKKNTSLFGASNSDSETDSELFSSGSNTVRKTNFFFQKSEKKTASSRFSGKLDSDEELFGSSKVAKGHEKSADAKPNKISLFDDSGSEEEKDLFGSKNVKSVESSDVTGSSGLRKVEFKSATVKKIQNKEVTKFDPQ